MTKTIIFPGGAGGNHLRWLMYLDGTIDEQLSIDDKLDFITDTVYSHERSFNNWLTLESTWRYTDKYESFIKILHEPKDDLPESKSVFLTFDDWSPVLEHYACLTSCFSNEDYYNLYNSFLHEFDSKIKKHITPSDNKLIIKSDVFFNEHLDKDYYEAIINLFEFENHYDEACIVHNLWYQSRKKAQKEFYEFYTGPFWTTFLNRMGRFKDVHIHKGTLP